MNMKELIENSVVRVVEYAQENNGVIDFEIDEDLLATTRINGVTIESDDELYNEMISLLNNEVVDKIIEGAERTLLVYTSKNS